MTAGTTAARTVVSGRALVSGRGTGSPTTGGGDPETPPLPNAPVIGTITESDLDDTGCTITIPVDQPVQCYLVYDTDSGSVKADYADETVREESFTYSTHIQRISGIAPGTTIYYRAVVTNAAAQETVSDEGSFETTGGVELEYPSATTLTYSATPSQSRPAHRVVTAVTGADTHVYRITNTHGWGPFYPRQQVESPDGQVLLFGRSQRRLFQGARGSGYGYLGQIPSGTSYPVWSEAHPRRLYGVQDNTNVLKYLDLSGVDVSATISEATTGVVHGAWQTLRTFSGYAHVSIGEYEGGISDDGSVLALNMRTTGGQNQCVSYDPLTDTILGTLNLPAAPNNVAPSRSGTYVIVQGQTPNGTGKRVYTANGLSFVRSIDNDQNDHWVVMYDASGNEVVVDVWSGLMTRLSDGVQTRVMPEGNNPGVGGTTPLSYYGHVGTPHVDRNGIAIWSAAHGSNTDIGRDQLWGGYLDSNTGTYAGERFGWLHGSFPPHPGYECNATMDRSGTRVFFVSPWDGSVSTQLHAYVVGMEAML